MNTPMTSSTVRREFFQAVGLGAAALSFGARAQTPEKVIPGFEQIKADANTSKGWKPISDRKIRVGIAGYGVCKSGAAFVFRNHPNVQVAAVTDLIPDRCVELAKVCRCEKAHPSLEEAPLHGGADRLLQRPPKWHPTHSNACHACVTGGSFTEVSCMGMPSVVKRLQAANNRHKNPLGAEVALLRTSEGGMARMVVSRDTPGFGGVIGRIRGQKETHFEKYAGLEKQLPPLVLPPLPPGVQPGGHGDSHGYLMNESVTAILQDREPLVDIAASLNMTIAGIVARQSALKDGELMKIPQFRI